MRLVLIIAGTNHPSNSDTLGRAFIDGCKNGQETQVETVILRETPLDHFTLAHYDPKTDQGENFRRIEGLVTNADGIVIATPIWNFSVPGHLKNLIDRMGAFGLDAQSRSVGTLKGKPCFLLYTGGSPAVVWTGLQKRTLSHMTVSLRYFGLTVIGSHYEERCTLGKGKFGLVVDKRPSSLEAMRKKGQSFAAIVDHYAKTGQLPWKQRVILKAFRFGQKMKRKLGI